MKENISVEKICQDLINVFPERGKATVNLIMAACSCTEAKSVVELTQSPHFNYTYSNISKITAYLTTNQEDYQKLLKKLLHFFLASCAVVPLEDKDLGNYYRLAQDACMLDKTHSACLEGRVLGHTSNRLDKGIVAGLQLGFTQLWLGKNWALPTALDVVCPTDETQKDATVLAVKQLEALLVDEKLPFSHTFCVNSADSGYGNAKFLSPLHKHKKLINVVRLRSGMKVYRVYAGKQEAKQKPKIYGEVRYLIEKTRTICSKTKNHKTGEIKVTEKEQTSIFEDAFDTFFEESIVLSNGRKAIKKIWFWKNYLIRTKKGNNMQDKPFDLLKVEIWNEDNSAKIFDRGLFLSINGQAKDKLSFSEAYLNYRSRFDVEGCYRLSKQHLFLDGFQSPDLQHYLNYLLVIFSTWWILYAAREEVSLVCPVWQKYLPANKLVSDAEKQAVKVLLTPSQVRKGMKALFDTFDKMSFLPQKSKKGLGRTKGTKMKKRELKNPYKKAKKEVKKE